MKKQLIGILFTNIIFSYIFIGVVYYLIYKNINIEYPQNYSIYNLDPNLFLDGLLKYGINIFIFLLTINLLISINKLPVISYIYGKLKFRNFPIFVSYIKGYSKILNNLGQDLLKILIILFSLLIFYGILWVVFYLFGEYIKNSIIVGYIDIIIWIIILIIILKNIIKYKLTAQNQIFMEEGGYSGIKLSSIQISGHQKQTLGYMIIFGIFSLLPIISIFVLNFFKIITFKNIEYYIIVAILVTIITWYYSNIIYSFLYIRIAQPFELEKKIKDEDKDFFRNSLTK